MTRYTLKNDWTNHGQHATWTIPGGTGFTHHGTVDYLDWFQAVVAFDVDAVDPRTGKVIVPAGTKVRTGYGITADRFAEKDT